MEPPGCAAGTHDVLRILLEASDPADNRTALVPFVKALVPHVDTAAGTLTLDPLPGLLEASTPAVRRRSNPRNRPRGL